MFFSVSSLLKYAFSLTLDPILRMLNTAYKNGNQRHILKIICYYFKM